METSQQNATQEFESFFGDLHDRSFARMAVSAEFDWLESNITTSILEDHAVFYALCTNLMRGNEIPYVRLKDWSVALAKIFEVMQLWLGNIIQDSLTPVKASRENFKDAYSQKSKELGLSFLEDQLEEMFEGGSPDRKELLAINTKLTETRKRVLAATQSQSQERDDVYEASKKSSLETFMRTTMFLLDTFAKTLTTCESPLEKAFVIGSIAHSAKLSVPLMLRMDEDKIALQKEIGPYRCDFVFYPKSSYDDRPIGPVVIEVDGHSYHEKSVEQATRDRQRDRFLADQGFKVLRFHRAELEESLEKTIESLDKSIYAHITQHETEGMP